MSEPTKIGFDLVPNDDGDDPRIAKAVELHVQRELEKLSLRLKDKGAISPDAVENPERASRLADAANQVMNQATEQSRSNSKPLVERTTATFEGAEVTTTHRPDGTVETREERIIAAITTTRVHVGNLSKLLDSVKDIAIEIKGWVASGYGVCVKVLGVIVEKVGVAMDDEA